MVEEAPAPYVQKETIRNLLQEEPVDTRFESLLKHHLEFMSYLRPVLKEEVFDQEGDGWGFLATHVVQNNKMFHDILKERNR